MKSKKLTKILVEGMILSTVSTGCAHEAINEYIQESDVEALDEHVKEPVAEETTTEETEEAEPRGEDGHDYLLPFDYEPDKFFAVDSDGNPVREYDFKKIKEAFEYIDSELYVGCVQVVSGDTVIISDTVNDDISYTDVYAYNSQAETVTSVMTSEPDFTGGHVDIYDGKIYIGTSKYKSGDEDSDFMEYEVTVNEDGSFDARAASYPGLESYYHTHTWVHPHVNIGYENYDKNHDFSLKRVLDDFGFVIAHRVGVLGGGYEKIDADGTCTDLGIEADSISILGYSKDWVVYEAGRSEDGAYRARNIATGEEFVIDVPNSMSSLEIDDNKCYFVTGTGEFGSTASCVYEYHFDTRNIMQIYATENTPMADRYSANACVVGHNFFYQKVDDGRLKWYRIDLTKAVGDGEDTGFSIREANAYKYGDIKYDSKRENCPYCGIPIYKGYEEQFVLKSEYSAHADEINAFFEDKMKASMERTGFLYDEVNRQDSAEDCEEHKESPWAFCETDESYITDVNIVKDKYLTVNYGSYWYGGGVHGMPYKCQYIFDLETGEQKTVKDFFNGTEDDFRKLVAEKVKEDFVENYNEFKYFAADGEAVYEDAYEGAGFDYGPFFIAEDSVTFSFTPYAIGPYASGFIDVELPIDRFDF